MKRLMAGAEPFFFPGDKTGCLLIHGFTGTPFEMRELGQHLAGQGFSVVGPRLFGHATDPRDLLRARWQDWYASVEDAYNLLVGVCDRIIPIGLSMGGVLTLLAAARLEVSGAVPMSTPILPPDPRMKPLRPLAPLFLPFWHFTAKGPSDWHDLQAEATHLEYPQHVVRGGMELYDLIAEVRRSLAAIQCPVLIIQSRQDQAVAWSQAETLRDLLPSRDKQIVWLEDSGHVVTRDAERQRVFEVTTAFVRRVAGERP